MIYLQLFNDFISFGKLTRKSMSLPYNRNIYLLLKSVKYIIFGSLYFENATITGDPQSKRLHKVRIQAFENPTFADYSKNQRNRRKFHPRYRSFQQLCRYHFRRALQTQNPTFKNQSGRSRSCGNAFKNFGIQHSKNREMGSLSVYCGGV